MADVLVNKLGLKYEIVGNEGKYFIVHFIESGQYELVFNAMIVKGTFQDHSQPYLHSVGYATGTKEKPLEFRRDELPHKMWTNMITRCYKDGGIKNYKDVAVCPEWHNYSNFLEWVQKQLPKEASMFSSYVLDKDILSTQKNCKIYSPQTSCIITNSFNSMAVHIDFTDYSSSMFKRVEKLKEKAINSSELGEETIKRIVSKADEYIDNFKKSASKDAKEDVAIYESVDLIAFIEYENKLYKFSNTRQLKEFASRIEEKQSKNEKPFL